jgi:hypothetical protein
LRKSLTSKKASPIDGVQSAKGMEERKKERKKDRRKGRKKIYTGVWTAKYLFFLICFRIVHTIIDFCISGWNLYKTVVV